MTEDIQPEVLKRTQESLGKFIKKPVLSEKLLRKPPFRFLHDICTAAMKETGFFEGTLSGNDIRVELINGKEGKIAFLQKVIAAVETANNVKLTVKPNKIVAGHEPMKTNEFLQALANALEKQVKTQSPQKTIRKSNKKPETKEESVVNKKNKVNRNTDVKKKKPVEKKTENETKPVEKKAEIETKPVEQKTEIETEPVELKNEIETKPVEIEPEVPSEPVNDNQPLNGENGLENGIDDVKNMEHAVRPASAKLKKRTPSARPEIANVESVLGEKVKNEPVPPVVEEINSVMKDKEKTDAVPMTRPRTAIRPPSARPASARPAAPRIRDRGQITLQEEVIKPAAGKVNLIAEQEAQQDDEELVSVQTVPEPVTESVPETDTAEHGQLVNQILEAQKELEDDAFTKKSNPARTEIEWSTGRGIEGTRKEVERLRVAVQTLTRSANPLGKLLEYLQEDVDSMQQELHSWRERNATLNSKLESERSLTDKSIEPLKAHLEELELSIQQELTQIGAVKATVLRNDEKINRLFLGI